MALRRQPSRHVNGAANNFNFRTYLRDRQLGLKPCMDYRSKIAQKLYSSLNKYDLDPYKRSECNSAGIFNLEYSLDGRLLVAACEKDCILIHDSANQQLIKTVEKAHANCVNCVRFLDDRIFATCSDDNTIKLWDIRNLRKEVRTLHAHSNWVKNIEFSVAENVMVTSAFDGSIYTWDLKSFTESSLISHKVFLMSGLMRTKLSPDGRQMIISTTSGYIILIHDLNLNTLAKDLRSFQPIIYRLMQTTGQVFPTGSVSNFLFSPTRTRNRVEFIDDFTSNVEVISSLQIHPHGWNAASRSMSASESSEITCVHDIQKRDPSDYEDCFIYVEEDGEEAVTEGAVHRPTDLWMGSLLNFQYEMQTARLNIYRSTHLRAMEVMSSGLLENRTEFNDTDERYKVRTNLPRLTHYINEKNVGNGFIKELCYSHDGRIICSPYDKGIRLLGFNEQYQEVSHCVPDVPTQLKPLVVMNNYHSGFVVSCKFNPTSMQLVSGCLNGEIVWYKPVF